MKPTIVTGKTWGYRDEFKELGGRWNHNDRHWEFYYPTPAVIKYLKGLIGVVISGNNDTVQPRHQPYQAPAPIPTNDVRIGDDMTYYNYFLVQNPMVFFGFSSLRKFAEHVESLERPTNRGGTCDVGWVTKEKYTGTKSLNHAVDLAKNGWVDGLGLMDQLFTLPAIGKKRIRSVAGGSVNVGRMLSGAPNHMSKRAPQPKRRIITIFVETVMWEGIQSNLAMMRVIIIAAMIDRLEEAGYSCNIVATYMARQRESHRGIQFAVRVKDAGERLSLADISFAFGHPSFGRRMCYASEGCVPQCNLTHEVRGLISTAFDDTHQPGRNEFYIPQLRFNSAQTVKDMIPYVQPENLPIELKVD